MATSSPESERLSLKACHISAELGFILPEPLTGLPPYYKPWMEIAQHVVELIDSHKLRSRVLQMPMLNPVFLEGHRELRLAHLALSIITMGYIWQEGEKNTVKILPRNLAVPYWEVSQSLGLPPILTHADAVLANWRKRDPDGYNTRPGSPTLFLGDQPPTIRHGVGIFKKNTHFLVASDIRSHVAERNLELLLSLPGGDSMRGFFLVTLLVEKAAVPTLMSIPAVINGVRDGDVQVVIRGLENIGQGIRNMTDKLKLMHAYVDPSVFYGIMRIYLSGWKDNPSMPEGLVYEGVQDEPLEFSGGSAAQSSVLHCFDQLLGVHHEPQSGAFLTRMREYMPPAHKRFIQDISRQPSLRNFVQEQASEPLTRAFQLCVTNLLALRSYHINVVSRYITVPAARARQLRAQGRSAGGDTVSRAPTVLEERGTGGSGIMSFLKSVRNQTRVVSLPVTNDNGVHQTKVGGDPQSSPDLSSDHTTQDTH